MARVLVVDDDRGTRDTFRAALELAGHAVAQAETVAQGLAAVGASTFDLVLVDLRLPDASGLEFLVEVREYLPFVRTVLMTALPTRVTGFTAARVGADVYAEKPISCDELLRLVADQLPSNSEAVGRRTHGEYDHAAARWLMLMIPVALGHRDVPRLQDWAKCVGRSEATIKQWCSNAGVRASDALDFARALRIVLQFADSQCSWFSVLEIIDSRTLRRFLARARIDPDDTVPNIRVFLRDQQFVTSPVLTEAVRRWLGHRKPDPAQTRTSGAPD